MTKKYTSKYYRLYGYSIRDVCEILGWSHGTVHAYFNNKKLRKAMLQLVSAKEYYSGANSNGEVAECSLADTNSINENGYDEKTKR